MSLIIRNHIFNSKTKAEEYTRNLIKEIGICSSIKNKSTNYYDFLFNLCQRHPNKNKKLKNIIDFCIIKNKLNSKAFELNII